MLHSTITSWLQDFTEVTSFDWQMLPVIIHVSNPVSTYTTVNKTFVDLLLKHRKLVYFSVVVSSRRETSCQVNTNYIPVISTCCASSWRETWYYNNSQFYSFVVRKAEIRNFVSNSFSFLSFFYLINIFSWK